MSDTNPLLAAFEAATAPPAPVEPAAPAAPVAPEGAPVSDIKDAASLFNIMSGGDPTPPAPTPVEPVAPVEPPAAPTEFALPETLTKESPEARARWGELRNELDAARKKAAEFEAKIQELSKPGDIAKALETKVQEYESKVKEYEQELAVTRVEATAEYKNLVTKPLDAIIETAENLAKFYSTDPKLIIAALSETDLKAQTDKLNDVVDGMSERDRARLYRMADDAALIFQKDEDLRSRAETALAEVEARQKADSEKSQQQRRLETRQATQKVWSMIRERTPDIGVDFATLEGDVMASDFDTATTEAKGYATSAAVLFPHVVKALSAKEAKIASLESALRSLQKAAPGGGSTVTPAPGSAPTNPLAALLFGN